MNLLVAAIPLIVVALWASFAAFCLKDLAHAADEELHYLNRRPWAWPSSSSASVSSAALPT